ncbi:MAG TPA: TraB/GumN family protein [Methanoculleus sp.]|nr:TraB/GumN family protein [Methanoculleus sp.]
MGEIRIVGTAHVSQKSVDEVRQAIDEFAPDIIAVELDRGRLAALKGNAPPPSVEDVLKSGNFSLILAQWLLSYIQRKIGDETGVPPGSEMMAAVEVAEERGIPYALADRDINITFSRFWTLMPLFEKVRIGWAMVSSLAGIGSEDEIDIDQLTDQDMISAAMEEFHRFAPKGAAALIDERDAYLSYNILALAGTHERVLSVVGAGHVEGINRFIRAPETLPPRQSLTAQPKRFPWGKAFGIFIAAIFAFFLVLIAFSGAGMDVLLSAVLYWVVINGILAAVGTLVAGGHPLSALTAFAVAWMTSLNPFMAAGWFAAATEAKLRRPKSSDFAAIMKAETITEMRRIPLFKVVLVAALANIGSMAGTFAYILVIMPILGVDPRVILTDGFANLTAFLAGLLPF